MPIKISILHSSFGRPEMALEAYKAYVCKADFPQNIEYILSLDDIDSTIEQYKINFNEDEQKKVGKFVLSVGPSTCAVQATNRAGTLMSEESEIYIVIADDIDCQKSWDTSIISLLKDNDNFKIPKAIKVFDGFWNINVPRMTIMIANKAFYKRLGYISYPEYISWCADDDYYELCKRLDCIIDGTHLTFQHRHYSLGFYLADTINNKNETEDVKAFGYKIFNERLNRNFDL